MKPMSYLQMPYKPKHPCSHPGCKEVIPADERYCDFHRKRKQQQDDTERGTAHERGYTSQWRRARRIYLNANPLCAECRRQGIDRLATVVDHIIPHRGDYGLFWDADNWQSLCKQHHDEKTAKEDGGFKGHEHRD